MNQFHIQPQVVPAQNAQPVQNGNPVPQTAPQQVPNQQFNSQPAMYNNANYGYGAVDQYGNPVQQQMYQNTSQYQQPMMPAQQSLMQQAPASPTVQATGDATAQVQAYLDVAGISRSQVEQELSQSGTISLATRQALVAAHGESTTNLLVNYANTMHQSTKATQTAAVTERNDYVAEAFKDMTQQTGAETFQELVSWWSQPDASGKSKLSVAERKEINDMLGAGGFKAKLVLDKLIQGFRQNNGVTQDPMKQIIGSGESAQGATGSYIDAVTYANEYDKIMNSKGPNAPELAALNAQRTRSMQRER